MNSVDPSARALLDLVEADRATRCAQVLDEARARAAALRAQAHTDALARLRQAFAEQRQRRDERVAAAQARLATQRRLHEQQRTSALLLLAWEQLPAELLALWRQPGTRAQWVARVLDSARLRIPQGPWLVRHAPDWPAAEWHALSPLPPATRFEADASIDAGLRVLANGNVIDGTLAGLLAERNEHEARLLRLLEEET